MKDARMLLNDFLDTVYRNLRAREICVRKDVFVEIFSELSRLARERLRRFDTIALPGVGVVWFEEGSYRFRAAPSLVRLMKEIDLEKAANAAELDKAHPAPEVRRAAQQKYDFFL